MRYSIGVSDVCHPSIGSLNNEVSHTRTKAKGRYFDFLKRRTTKEGKRKFMFLTKETAKFIEILKKIMIMLFSPTNFQLFYLMAKKRSL
jgi:hypothetical protein